MTPLDRLAELCVEVDFEPLWREVADALIAVARLARIHVKGGGMRNAQRLSDALTALDSAITKELGG